MTRLDVYLGEKEFSSREKAKTAILEGKVLVNGTPIKRPSFLLEGNELITVEKDDFVSRGGYKIKTAYERFEFDYANRTVLDIGASTGGFTQFALNNGATKVYALDVGRGELDKKLRFDSRVVCMEGIDFRRLEKGTLTDVNLIIGDLSFISLKHILPKIIENFGKNIEIVMLFKPQFECGKEIAKKYKGVINDKRLHKKLLKEFVEYINGFGFCFCNLTFSNIRGKEGNIEYLFHLNGRKPKSFDVEKIVDSAFENLKN